LPSAFGTVENVVTASAERLAAVPGIGPEVAPDIRWAVGEKKERWPVI
jgi:ERCC4-type nuclease